MRGSARALMVAAALTCCLGMVRADDKTAGRKEASLGIGVEPVPSALHSQMPGILPKNEGVLVAHVVKDSAAAKAGLQQNDILTTYAGHAVSSPEQLVKMARSDKPGHEVTLGCIHGGKAMTSKVVLGETRASADQDDRRVIRLVPNGNLETLFEETESRNGESGWDAFDAMKLTRTDANHFQASIEYRSRERKKEAKNFSGTREEIRKAIDADKDLPGNERNHLLRALNLHNPIFEFHFPASIAAPGFDRP
jgi:hypothetical protein